MTSKPLGEGWPRRRRRRRGPVSPYTLDQTALFSVTIAHVRDILGDGITEMQLEDICMALRKVLRKRLSWPVVQAVAEIAARFSAEN